MWLNEFKSPYFDPVIDDTAVNFERILKMTTGAKYSKINKAEALKNIKDSS